LLNKILFYFRIFKVHKQQDLMPVPYAPASSANLQSNGSRLIFVDSLTNVEGDDRKLLRLHTLTAMSSPRYSLISSYCSIGSLHRSTNKRLHIIYVFITSRYPIAY